ncbi:hypothetical protein OPHB3_1271 [Oceanobacillus picturae]|uniref:Uncharacterized protein n=1 Tax=Oceanobacillus picturae TaxID=171693 RepID=A0A0U9H402_9BACI|nr:hypothetical protein OPHB3_1271 [Oceanobacillus picturae]
MFVGTHATVDNCIQHAYSFLNQLTRNHSKVQESQRQGKGNYIKQIRFCKFTKHSFIPSFSK